MRELTFERLRELFAYDAKTGVFTKKNSGAPTGSANRAGYLCLRIDGRTYLAHRLAWLFAHSHWPANHIDHIDGDRANNRLSNLRDVPRTVNMQNMRRAPSSGTSGHFGATYNKLAKKWIAQIRVGGRNKALGYFDTPEKASAAYVKAKRELHEGCTI